jgi:cytochrome c-type biogenesis protein CcmF
MVPLLALLAVGMHSAWKKWAPSAPMRNLLLGMLVVSIVFAVVTTEWGYGEFRLMGVVGLGLGAWIVLSSLYEPVTRLRNGQSLSRGVIGMTIAHIGVGLFAIGVTVTQSYRIEKDIGLRPGESVQIHDYSFRYDSAKDVQGPNYHAIEAQFTVTQNGEPVAVLHPQKRIYRVQRSPMTEAGIEVDWNRDLFVALGEDLGDTAWSVRVQYKPMVRFIWIGAIVMALGGLIGMTDRRYRTKRATASDPAGGRAATRTA